MAKLAGVSFASEHLVAAQAREDVRAGRSLTEVMGRAFDLIDEHEPLPVWRQLRALDFEDDVRQSSEAVVRIVAEQPPPEGLSAVLFLLCEFADADLTLSSTSSAVELSGATTYPTDGWPFGGRDVMWFPDAYLPAPGLAGLAGAAARDEEVRGVEPGGDAFGLATYDLAFAHALGLAADLVRGPAGASLLGGRDRLGVAAGFADGDFLLVGELTPAGLDLARFSWI